MGEVTADIIDVAYKLRELEAESIPVNFLIPIEGNTVKNVSELSPEFCLRILCLYRFLNPTSELRVAAGREIHLRSMEVMALYPANSLFLEGYLNTRGTDALKTLQMIKDAGFTIKSEKNLEDLLMNEKAKKGEPLSVVDNVLMKNLSDLRPYMPQPSERSERV